MRNLVFLLTFAAFLACTIADSCDDPGYIRNGNFARKVGDCRTMYVCRENIAELKGTCNGTQYYCLSNGLCLPQRFPTLKYYYGAETCEEEEVVYKDMEKRRKEVCEAFNRQYTRHRFQMIIETGDYADCRRKFSCFVESGQDWKLLCPAYMRFSDSKKQCLPNVPDSDCAKRPTI